MAEAGAAVFALLPAHQEAGIDANLVYTKVLEATTAYVEGMPDPIMFDGVIHVDAAMRVTLPDTTYRVMVKVANANPAVVNCIQGFTQAAPIMGLRFYSFDAAYQTAVAEGAGIVERQTHGLEGEDFMVTITGTGVSDKAGLDALADAVDELALDGASCLLAAEGTAADLPLDQDPYTISAWIQPDPSAFPDSGIVSWGTCAPRTPRVGRSLATPLRRRRPAVSSAPASPSRRHISTALPCAPQADRLTRAWASACLASIGCTRPGGAPPT